MDIAKLLDPTLMVSGPPPGSVNVRIGKSVEGPGGKWVPCATEIPESRLGSAFGAMGPKENSAWSSAAQS